MIIITIIAFVIFCIMLPTILEVVCALIGVIVGLAIYVLPTLAVFAGTAYILAVVLT